MSTLAAPFSMIVESCLALLTTRSVELVSIRAVSIFSAIGVSADLLLCFEILDFSFIEGGLGIPVTFPTFCGISRYLADM